MSANTYINGSDALNSKLKEFRSKIPALLDDVYEEILLKDAHGTDNNKIDQDTTNEFESFVSSDSTLLRYLRAYNWSVDKAFSALKKTLIWRNDYKPHKITLDQVKSEAINGNNYVNGFDRFSRPIIYLKKRGQLGDAEKNVRLLVWTMEYAAKVGFQDLFKHSYWFQFNLFSHRQLMPDNVEKICLIMDFSEYTRANSPPISISMQTLDILTSHYPERLGISFMINAPFAFSALWMIISPFLHAVTKEKIRFVISNSEILEVISPEVLEAGYGGTSEYQFNFDMYKASLAKSE
ncbi:hypothetical protein HK098_002391 [Nowakowskiella sp. JEL0407]|nr:hypothetical protein HK098_002391 [Nowakowskiella sp. JEL0407]